MKKFNFIFSMFFMFFLFASNIFADSTFLVKQSENSDSITNLNKKLHEKIWCEVVNLPSNKRPKIALVLGGGGARGFAHIGILEVFEEEKIPIDMVVGTSMGAVIGSLYASGLSPKAIENITATFSLKDLIHSPLVSFFRLFFQDKLINSNSMGLLISKNIENKQFRELNIQFACVATDIVTGEKVVLRDGDVATAVRASSSIPGIFEPVEYKQRYLVDGGIVDNVPVDVAKMLGADIIIAVNIEADYTKNELKKVINMLFQISYIQGQRLNSKLLKDADFILNPDVNNLNITDLTGKNFAVLEGRKEARQNIDTIKTMIINKIVDSVRKN